MTVKVFSVILRFWDLFEEKPNVKSTPAVKTCTIGLVSALICRLMLDWIAGLHNPDCNPIWWIELQLKIQSQNLILDLDCQSSFVISIQIQNFIIILSKNLNFIVHHAPIINQATFHQNFQTINQSVRL